MKHKVLVLVVLVFIVSCTSSKNTCNSKRGEKKKKHFNSIQYR